MSVFEFVWERLPAAPAASDRRHRRRRATTEARLRLLEQEVSELEQVCQTLLYVIREAGVMTDDRVDALLASVQRRAADAADPAGAALPQRPEM